LVEIAAAMCFGGAYVIVVSAILSQLRIFEEILVSLVGAWGERRVLRTVIQETADLALFIRLGAIYSTVVITPTTYPSSIMGDGGSACANAGMASRIF
jgi:hypothetical protein